MGHLYEIARYEQSELWTKMVDESFSKKEKSVRRDFITIQIKQEKQQRELTRKSERATISTVLVLYAKGCL